MDMQGSMRAHHHHHHQQHQSLLGHPTIHETFPLSIGSLQGCNKSVCLNDYGIKSASDEEEPSFTEDRNRGKKTPVWHRVKWSDQMVRLLITAVSYIGEEAAAEYSVRRKCSNLHKKGKWRLVSKVMAERGHFVSPQQCEDKFNDLNKRYKRLNEILGRGTSCEVVENPSLLDVMDHLSERAKEEVRKILSSKHLHYEEMCSYHNGNRLHLPPDPELQHSLHLALRSRDDGDDNDGDDQDGELNEHEECEEYGVSGSSGKRAKPNGDANQTSQKNWLDHRTLQLEEQKLYIQGQMLELENERLKWRRFTWKKDSELEMMRMENERMKLENEHIAMELKRKKMFMDNS